MAADHGISDDLLEKLRTTEPDDLLTAEQRQWLHDFVSDAARARQESATDGDTWILA